MKRAILAFALTVGAASAALAADMPGAGTNSATGVRPCTPHL